MKRAVENQEQREKISCTRNPSTYASPARNTCIIAGMPLVTVDESHESQTLAIIVPPPTK
jgi:hypothetical protein